MNIGGASIGNKRLESGSNRPSGDASAAIMLMILCAGVNDFALQCSDAMSIAYQVTGTASFDTLVS